MIALLNDRAAMPALLASSFPAPERTRAAAFANEVWELHHIIASPSSRAGEVKMAKRQLLRRLRKSPPIVVSKESRRKSTRGRRFFENARSAAAVAAL